MKRKIMTAQGIFNFVWRFMEKQGVASDDGESCQYRTVDSAGRCWHARRDVC